MVAAAKRLAWNLAEKAAPKMTRRYRLARYVEDHVQPVARADGTFSETVAHQPRPVAGIDLRETAQLKRLRGWERYRSLYETLRADSKINTWHLGGDRIHNGYYGSPDAEAYASMIADFRPERIVEVGGGYSSLIARRTIDTLSLASELVVVDPQPRTDVSDAADMLVRQRGENTDLAALVVGRSFLFIDSSHVSRIGGDVPFLYGQVIPALPRGTVIHVHDIFIPFDYPRGADRFFWNEQYVLEALLSDSPRYQVELATHFLSHEHPDELQRLISPAAGSDPFHFGGALWFTVAAEAAV